KPANIFMIGRAQPKVLDFGIARIAHRHDVHGGDAELAAGSPYYMAPEQARQEPVDRRADVFSLGVVLYEMLTDGKPFRGETLDEITQAVLKHEPPLANVVDPQVPAPLAEIAAKAMAKNPDDRYRSARAFARELRHWLEENTNSAVDADAPIASEPHARHRWIAAGVLGAAVLGGLIWAAMPSKPVAPAAPVVAARPAAVAPQVPAPASVPVAVAPTAAPPAAAASTASDAASATVVERVVAPAPAPAKAPAAVATAPRETPKERRAREVREREARAASAAAAAPPAPAAPARGLVRIAISPWGDVEVDGKPAGTSPPVTELSLTEGRHQIVIRNADLPPHSVVVNVTADQPITLKHRF
ncbi:MAG: serine/threonine-protein kinase, partial [Burkholderiales bacterium]